MILQLKELDKTVSETVRADYRTADVFKNHGINYCCGGQVTLREVCAQKGIDMVNLLKELALATRNVSLSNQLEFNAWKIDFLVDYIINVHHTYIRQFVPGLQQHLNSFTNSHRNQFPQLDTAKTVFEELVQILGTHSLYEEQIIFPYIKQIDSASRHRESYGNLFVRTLRKPLHNIENDHNKISNLLVRLRNTTNDYCFPENACTNHRVVFNKLKELDHDLMQHKHLENNILFPRAIQLEAELLLL
jgi:regulator of cell morphogenesis and NO signaling